VPSLRIAAERGENMIVKVLSLHQPWASFCLWTDAVNRIFKSIETRSWCTGHRGRLYIHASASLPPYARGAALTVPFKEAIAWITNSRATDAVNLLPRGAILGHVELVDCIKVKDLIDTADDILRISQSPCEKHFGNYALGRRAWIFNNAVRFPYPIQAKGARGVWDHDLQAESLS
jgi:hypothetical protein